MSKPTADEIIERLECEASKYVAPEHRIEQHAANAMRLLVAECRAWRTLDNVSDYDENGQATQTTINAHDRACECSQRTDESGMWHGATP